MNDDNERKHWLLRPATIKKCWLLLYLVLALSVAAELFFPNKGYFGIDGSFAFSAWFGFTACLLMVVFAKLLGYLIKRSDDYYDD